MGRFLKSAVLSLAVAATTFAAIPNASAGERWHGDRGWRYHQKHNRGGDIAAAGILGLAAGALIVGLTQANREPVYANPYRHPRPRPIRDYPVPVAPQPPVHYDYVAAMEPWTAEWYQYCSGRYRSFNGRTGTFRGYDGQDHFCVAN